MKKILVIVLIAILTVTTSVLGFMVLNNDKERKEENVAQGENIQEKKTQGKSENTKVLFIGTSHTYANDMVKTFKDISEGNQKDIDVTMLAAGGQPLIWHYEQPETRFNILYGDYDYIVLQNAAHPFWKWELDEGLEKMKTLLDQTDAKVILFMTWAEIGVPEYEAIQEGFKEAHERTGYTLAPVGEYFKELLDTRPDMTPYAPDNSHASEFGSYVTAKVIYQTIFDETNRLNSETIIEDYIQYKARSLSLCSPPEDCGVDLCCAPTDSR